MKGWEKDGVGPSIVNNEPEKVNNTGPFCDTCWSEAVTVVNGANLCRTHRKAYLGVTS